MKAAQINQYGGKDALKTVSDAPKPKAGKGEVLVAVDAASANPFDWKVREGYMKGMVDLNFPATLGGDFAGTVAELGEGVSGFSEGDEVYGQARALSGNGSFAEFAPIKNDNLAPKPKSVNFETAAALPLTGVSAYQALVEHADLQKGQKVLIQGGAGGIGTMAVQLAKHLGAYVATTVSTKDIDFATSLGADKVIDYTSEDFTKVAKDYDAVFDLVGGEVAEKSCQVLKKGGILVSMLGQLDEELTKRYGINMVGLSTQVTRERLDKLTELVGNGALKAHIDKIFPLDQAAEALDYVQNGKPQGKIVINIK